MPRVYLTAEAKLEADLSRQVNCLRSILAACDVRQGISKREMARRSGLSATMVSLIIHNEDTARGVRLGNVLRLIRSAGVTPEEWLKIGGF